MAEEKLKWGHSDALPLADESPAEKTLREAYNDHGRALMQLRNGNAKEAEDRAASPSNSENQYRLNEDGDEDK